MPILQAYANFNFTPSSGATPLSVAFTDFSSTGSSGWDAPSAWAWTFGDGGTSSLQNPTYIFNTAGTFDVALTTTFGASGSKTSSTQSITVAAGAPAPAPQLGRRVATAYEHVQSSAATVWNIVHGLGGYPIVDAYITYDGVLQRILPLGVTYVDDNSCSVTFSSPRAGFASVA